LKEQAQKKPATEESLPWRGRLASSLALERNVTAASAAVFLLMLGEELWKKYLPKYLEALGAGTLAIGLFGTTKDFFDAIYQYPGGWLADRLGRRRAFLFFISLACAGYLIYWFSPTWPFVFLGLAFAMAWASMASPAVFAVIGDALPREKRAMGFTFQSFLKRIPMAIAPIIGGVLIARNGTTAGIRIGLVLTLGLAFLAALIVRRINIPIVKSEALSIKSVWQSFHSALKKLLISDVIIRICEGLADVLIVLYVTNISGISLAHYGSLVAAQMLTSMVVYLPAGKIADRIGRKPFVIVTFLCFALFPLAVIYAKSSGWLLAAFIIGGLREIGEPSRKAMIVDFAAPHLRARTVGLYYLVRSLTITPAAAIGGWLWTFAPQTPFLAAGVIGLIGTLVFALTVDERYAG
jgi:MFS family permease